MKFSIGLLIIFIATFFTFGVEAFLFGTVGLTGDFHDKVETCLNPPSNP